ncbi:MAG: phage head-tail connector protein [Aigarchaeota archaeon]|nr:phage head-tail connector protein [Aigarchaeota archaeon]MDW8093079.1 phage head-tail connector protein [Nitrososphaerota archaeon]
MTYANLERVKAVLRITGNEEDNVLSTILQEVDAEINTILMKYTQLPITDERIRTILAGIEAEWAGGVYRSYVEPSVMTYPEHPPREHVLITNAKRRLRELIEVHLKKKVDTI